MGAHLGRGARGERGGRGDEARPFPSSRCAPGRGAGVAPIKQISVFSLSIYKYILYIYLCRHIYIILSSLSGKDKRLIHLRMHDQSHQPTGTAGRAPPPAGALGRGPHPAPPPAYCCSGPVLLRHTSAGGRSQRDEIPLQSAREVLVTRAVAPGDTCRWGTLWRRGGMVGIAPGPWVLREGGGGRRHPVERQSLDKAKKK